MYHVKNLYLVAIILLVVTSCIEPVKQEEKGNKIANKFVSRDSLFNLANDTGYRIISTNRHKFLYTDSNETIDPAIIERRVKFANAEMLYRQKLIQQCHCWVTSEGGFFKSNKLRYNLAIQNNLPDGLLKKENVLNDLKTELFSLLPGTNITGSINYYKNDTTSASYNTEDTAITSPYLSVLINENM